MLWCRVSKGMPSVVHLLSVVTISRSCSCSCVCWLVCWGHLGACVLLAFAIVLMVSHMCSRIMLCGSLVMRWCRSLSATNLVRLACCCRYLVWWELTLSMTSCCFVRSWSCGFFLLRVILSVPLSRTARCLFSSSGWKNVISDFAMAFDS